jgi:hypothetical protein
MKETMWWQVPVLTGSFALVGVLIAQSIVLWLARRNDRRRSEPELLKQCAAFSVAAGRLKAQISQSDDPDLSAIDDVEAAADAIIIIGTPALEDAIETFIGRVPVAIAPEKFGVDAEEAARDLFTAHRDFIDAARKHFNRPPKVYKATPMLTTYKRRPGA